jgi:hypothetical protein
LAAKAKEKTMASKKLWMSVPVIALVFAMAVSSCDNGSTGGGGNPLPPPLTNPWDKAAVKEVSSGENLTSAINDITEPGYYILNLTSNTDFDTDFEGVTLDTDGVNMILRGTNSSRAADGDSNITITWKRDKPKDPDNPVHLFKVENGAGLFLEDITLLDDPDNPYWEEWGDSLIEIYNRGKLEIRNGAVITGSPSIYIYGGGSVTMSGGTLKGREKKSAGVQFPSGDESSSFTMTGGVITGNFSGINSASKNNSVTISGGKITDNDYGMLLFNQNSSIKILGNAEISNNNTGIVHVGDSQYGVISANHTVTISGNASISGNVTGGIWADGSGHNITISGGNFNNNERSAIGMGGTRLKLSISGGTISGNKENGIYIEGSGHNITISGGTISGNKENSIWANGNGHNITVSGGTFSNNDEFGIGMNCTGLKLSISGGTISGNKKFGLVMNGANNEFIKTGGIIYGKDANNSLKNGDGAIQVFLDWNWLLTLSGDAARSDRYAVKTDETGIVSMEPDTWD